MSENIKVYWKPDCKFCELAKRLLAQKGLDYTPIELGVDMSVEYFKMVNPGVDKVPAIFFDEIYIGGFDKLKERLCPEESEDERV